jgi:6-phosphogluconolactonase (cycloisomerase 2 family)
VANSNSSSVSAYTIDQSTGLLAEVAAVPASPYATGDSPYSVAVDPMGRFAYVGHNNPMVGAFGAVSAYAMNQGTGGLTLVTGSPFTTLYSPFSVTVDPMGRFVYAAILGSVAAFAINSPSGVLTSVTGSPFAAENSSAGEVRVDPTGRFVYATNPDTNNVSAYTIDQGTGALTPIGGSPFGAGLYPFSVAVDPTGKFAYVANSDSNNVSAYTIDQSSGVLTPISGSPFQAGTSPSSVSVDPSGKFVYVANAGSNNISAFRIEASGALRSVDGSPFPSGDPYSIAITGVVE